MVKVRNKIEISLKGSLAEIYTFHWENEQKEHLLIKFAGNKKNTMNAPLVRIHSECLTGDVFGSSKCDCGSQLNEAIDRMSHEGGYLVYLRQEGRGIGLYNKIDAYALQANGLDTFEANQALGFQDDLRNFDLGAKMLKAVGVTKIRLMTNNPQKVEELKESGIVIVEQIPTSLFVNCDNLKYLKAKAQKAHHHILL